MFIKGNAIVKIIYNEFLYVYYLYIYSNSTSCDLRDYYMYLIGKNMKF